MTAVHFGRNGSNFLGYHLLKTFQSLGTVLVYLGFEVAPREKNCTGSNLVNTAATRCHHARRQHAQKTFLWEFRANKEICSSSKSSSNVGRRKFSSIAQYWYEVTVTVASSPSKEYGPHTPNSKMAHHTVTLGLWSGRWWISRGLLWGQYRKFCLLTAWKVEMCLVHKQQNGSTENVLKEFWTQLFGFHNLFHSVLVQSQFCRGASWDLDAEFTKHFYQITVGHPRVSVQNAVQIAQWKLSQRAQFPVLLLSEVGQ
jgi:hypothetical protein